MTADDMENVMAISVEGVQRSGEVTSMDSTTLRRTKWIAKDSSVTRKENIGQ